MEDIINYEKKPEDDYYHILGCDQNSTVEQILAEYRLLALKLHPDKNPDDPEAEARFQKLQIAKTTLCDPEKRTKYDKWRSSGIAMSFENWIGTSSHIATTMHWATPNTKGRMVEPGQAGATGLSSASPSRHTSDHQQHRRASEVIRVNRPTEGWERDSSDILKKFRNYEI